MFVPLHNHSQWSTLDGFGDEKAWVSRVKEIGATAFAITDHGNIDSAIKMAEEASKNGIKFIIGCEFYICENMEKQNPQNENCHVVVFAKNQNGWKEILQMLTEANIRGYHYKPRIDGLCLLNHCKNVVVSTACVFSFLKKNWGRDLFKKLLEVIPKDLFLEIQPHDFLLQREYNKEVLEISEKYHLPVIATNDSHYPRKENAILQEVLLAIGTAANWDDPKRFKFHGDNFYLASEEEMKSFFQKNHPYMTENQILRALKNTERLANRCEAFVPEKKKPDLPIAPFVPIKQLQEEGKNEDDFFRQLVYEGLRKKKAEGLLPFKMSQYKERIEEELDLLIKKGFSRYFLIVIDIMTWCRENGIAVGPGRGSAAGCLCTYLTGICDVDPLKYDLLFSRFQSPEREDLPDIDCDFEQDRREDVVKHIKESYGEEHVVQITTFLTLKGRSALQDVGRVFGVPRDQISKVTSLLEDEDEITEESFKNSQNEEVRQFYKDHADVIRYSVAIQGCIRGYGKHAAGVCISNHNLVDGQNGNIAKRQGVFLSNWSKEEAEFQGLMKLDVLGLIALSRIRVCTEMIEENHGIKIDLKKIDVEDPSALKTIRTGDCLGLFQLGTYGITRLCKDVRVSSFQDVYNITALYRPGPLQSGLTEEFVLRKNGKKFQYLCPVLKNITEETQGEVIYQEQLMLACRDLAGFDWALCNKIRKVMAKSRGIDSLKVFKEKFLAGCKKLNTLDQANAEKLWEDFEKFGKYAFNKSHSVSYSVISMWDAWLKTHYLGEFYASCLSYLPEDKRIDLLKEAVDKGIKVLLPKTGRSHWKLWQYDPEKRELIMPYVEIIGIGENAAMQIWKSTKKKKKTFFGTKVSLDGTSSTSKLALKSIHSDEPSWIPSNEDIKKIKSLFKYNLNKIFNV